MRIVYYTSATTGSGHIVLGLSVYNGLSRRGLDCDYTILTTGSFTRLADRFGVSTVTIPGENEKQLGPGKWEESELHAALSRLEPDILIIDYSWFTLHHFIDTLPCKKIFICRQIHDSFFSIPLKEGELLFRPSSYDKVLSIEPFESAIDFEHIEPLIIRNRDEILSREEARYALGITDSNDSRVCLFAFNGKPGEFEEKKKMYGYLEEEGYRMVYSTNFDGGLFPAADYLNGVDLLICGAGYNAFWEAVYFEKETIFVPVKRRFEDQRLRVETCSDYEFRRNGADQLAGIIEGM